VPIKPEFGAKPMSYNEKAQLLSEIYQLQLRDKVSLLTIIGIIKARETSMEITDDFEVDVELLQPSTLRELEVFIAATLKKKLPKLSCK
jgi:hypothetical protein